MEKVQQDIHMKQGETADDLRLHVEQSPTRCPYCHDSIELDGGAWIACGDCLARHHTECQVEHGACASCGSVKKLVSEAVGASAEEMPKSSPGRLAGTILLIQSLALLFGALFHMNGQLISGLQWTTSVVFVATLVISALAFFKVRDETLQRRLFRLGLTNAIYLGIGIQVVFALYLWDIGSPNDPKTWAWLSGILSLYSAIQSHRIQKREEKENVEKAQEPLEQAQKT